VIVNANEPLRAGTQLKGAHASAMKEAANNSSGPDVIRKQDVFAPTTGQDVP
jgi:hypothetical protein